MSEDRTCPACGDYFTAQPESANDLCYECRRQSIPAVQRTGEANEGALWEALRTFIAHRKSKNEKAADAYPNAREWKDYVSGHRDEIAEFEKWFQCHSPIADRAPEGAGEERSAIEGGTTDARSGPLNVKGEAPPRQATYDLPNYHE